MANTPTTNYALQKPAAGDTGWANAMNGNLDAIDGQLKANADAVAGKADADHNHDGAYAAKSSEHSHGNQAVLDQLGEDSGGKLTYKGVVLDSGAGGGGGTASTIKSDVRVARTNIRIDRLHGTTGRTKIPGLTVDALQNNAGINAAASSGYSYDATAREIVGADALMTTVQGSTYGTMTAGVKKAQTIREASEISLSAVSVYGLKNSGTICDLTMEICADNAGQAGEVLATARFTVSSTSNVWTRVPLPTVVTMAANATYWVIIYVTPGTTSTYYWAAATGNPYPAGSLWNLGGTIWTADTNYDMSVRLHSAGIPGVVQFIADAIPEVPAKVYATVETAGAGTLSVEISRDGGTTWTSGSPESLIDVSAQPSGSSLAVRLTFAGYSVRGVAWGWE